MIYYQVYSKTSCPFCIKALDILEEHEKEFVVSTLDHAPEKIINKLKQECGQDTVPIILEVNDEEGVRLIGGYTELKKEFNKKEAKFLKRPKLEDMNEEERQKDEDYWHGHGQGD